MHKTLSLPRPDDWHLHLRDGAMMASVLASSADHFYRALIMPNLVPPVVTGAEAQAYKTRIMAQLPERSDFSPLMTLYLTEATDPEDLAKAFQSGLISAVNCTPRVPQPIQHRASLILKRFNPLWKKWLKSGARFAFTER